MSKALEAVKARVSDVPDGEMVAVYAETVRGLIGENERLRAALKPFAEYGKVFDRHVLGLQGKEHDSTPCATVTKWGGENQDIQIPVAHLYIGDLRNAARTLKGAPDGR